MRVLLRVVLIIPLVLGSILMAGAELVAAADKVEVTPVMSQPPCY
jgi:hypothetical protein